MDIGIVLDV